MIDRFQIEFGISFAVFHELILVCRFFGHRREVFRVWERETREIGCDRARERDSVSYVIFVQADAQ